MSLLHFSLLVFFTATASGASLPATFKRCQVKDANFNKCLRDSIEDAVRQMKSGIPNLNVQSIDPIEATTMMISAGSGPVNVAQRYSNVKLFGVSKGKIEKAEIDLDKDIINIDYLIPQLTMKADYDFNGRVLLLPITGKGPCILSLTNVLMHHKIKLERVTKKGKQHLKVTDYKLELVPEKAEYRFENLFNGDKQLGDAMNKILNDNEKEIFKDVGSGYGDSFALLFKDMANKIFARVPTNEIFIYDE